MIFMILPFREIFQPAYIITYHGESVKFRNGDFDDLFTHIAPQLYCPIHALIRHALTHRRRPYAVPGDDYTDADDGSHTPRD